MLRWGFSKPQIVNIKFFFGPVSLVSRYKMAASQTRFLLKFQKDVC